MQPLFPEIKPYARHRVQVDAGHNLYVDESGNETGAAGYISSRRTRQRLRV